ncbi:hypothetical protein [Candidatus Albibeggiatoa sp. nov. BB20]|uniref:hypothetical protein n=1 Tax=Candidatus Albibeggiatoa sp. nov. BB20 TaxID=3162723 RepID=UPI003365835E
MAEETEVRNIMSEFVSTGLNIKKLYSGFIPSAGSAAWERDIALFESVKAEFGLYQNFMQLLDSESEKNFRKLGGFILSESKSVLISLDILKTTLDAIEYLDEVYLPAEWKWEILGLDVCEANGLYSFLEMTSIDGKFKLFKEEQLLDALTACEKANFAIPEHSPFVVARLRRLISI